MQVTLKFFASFRETVGSKTIDREFEDGATVGEVLGALEEEYEDLRGQLIVDGDLKPQINVLKNGREVLHMKGIDTVVDEGDTISVFPPVAGGSE
jgi:molybdopterin synthase sulfur carrier subunit